MGTSPQDPVVDLQLGECKLSDLENEQKEGALSKPGLNGGVAAMAIPMPAAAVQCAWQVCIGRAAGYASAFDILKRVQKPREKR